jgi:hypothetical protein
MAYNFNNDLLLSKADQDLAKREFPNVFFALNFPGLRTLFQPFDIRANLSKTRSRRWGVTAVLLATLALMLAAAEVLLHHYPKELVKTIAGVGAIAGIASVLIGFFGIMFHERKQRWLADRLATERMRQFHFQTYIAYAGEILAGAADENAARNFLNKRTEELARFDTDVVQHVDEKLHHIVEAEDPGDGALFPGKDTEIDPDSSALAEYFHAYSVLRFDRQIGYCDLILRDSGAIWKYAPVQQARILSTIALVCVFGILILHGFVLLGVGADIQWMKGQFVHVAAVWAAVIALAARTLEEGFQPETEIERMRQYRLSLKRIYDRFKRTQSPLEKLDAMRDLEKLSYEEMVLFLRSNFEARFVM